MVNIYSEKDEGRKILIETSGRQIIVRVAVSELIKRTATSPETLEYYPGNDAREQTAVAIVELFPCLGLYNRGVQPHSHFYNTVSQTGCIQTRLNTLRELRLKQKDLNFLFFIFRYSATEHECNKEHSRKDFKKKWLWHLF